MLNGACKYHERRDTKGAPKRSGVRADRRPGGQAGGQGRREGEAREKGGDVRGRFIVCRARRIARAYTLQEKKDRKEVGGSTKGCFNSLLSSVAEQEEEKVTPPVRNYLANLRRMRARIAWRGRTRGRNKGREMNTGKGKGQSEERSSYESRTAGRRIKISVNKRSRGS